jgi:hypothetical protein
MSFGGTAGMRRMPASAHGIPGKRGRCRELLDRIWVKAGMDLALDSTVQEAIEWDYKFSSGSSRRAVLRKWWRPHD